VDEQEHHDHDDEHDGGAARGAVTRSRSSLDPARQVGSTSRREIVAAARARVPMGSCKQGVEGSSPFASSTDVWLETFVPRRHCARSAALRRRSLAHGVACSSALLERSCPRRAGQAGSAGRLGRLERRADSLAVRPPSPLTCHRSAEHSLNPLGVMAGRRTRGTVEQPRGHGSRGRMLGQRT
jgi:hypothetical protein